MRSKSVAVPGLLALAIMLASVVALAAIGLGPAAGPSDAGADQGARSPIARLYEGIGTAPLDGYGAGGAEVEGAVTAALDERERVPVIIRLRDQADVPALAAEARAAERSQGRDARVREVVQELKDTAAQTQPGVRSLLRSEASAGRARGIRSFWIFNGLAATVERGALERLAQHPEVESVTLDETIRLPETETEPRLPTWGLEKVRAAKTWGEYGYTGDGVVVGVMDSGVDGGHPALAGRYRGRNGDGASSWFAATGENYSAPGDGNGHGTHVTGSIVGGAPGEIVGVAPDAEWIAAKIFRDSGSTTTSIIHDGFQWMLAPGGDPAKAPDVVNNSWGSAATYNTEFLEDVRAWVAAGIFPAFANGNDGPAGGTVGSPGSFPESFAVGATDINDNVAWFSSRGPAIWDGVEHTKPQISAPGAEIYSTWPRQLEEGPYNTISGTSMATPHLTGVVALLESAQPDLSVEAIRELLTSTARSGPHMGRLPNDDYGHGIVDAHAAITAARFSGTLTGTVTGPDGPIAAKVAISELGVETTSDPATGFYELRVKEGSWDVTASAYGHLPRTSAITLSAGDELTRDFALPAAATHTLSGTVTAGGEPLPGARVKVAGTPLDPVYTDAAGAFSLTVAAGAYDVSAEATGHRRAVERVTVDGDETVTFALQALTGATAPEWAEFQNNPARSGLSSEELAAGALEDTWSVDLPGRVMFGSPVAAAGRVHVALDGGQLTTLDLDSGETLWSFSTGSAQRSTPAVEDGRVYVGGGDSGRFHALDAATGTPVWTFETGDRLTYATPTVVDGTVYFGTGWGEDNGGWVYALDADTGAQRWKTFVGAEIYFAPAVGGGRVFAASYGAQKLVALDAATGQELWSASRTMDSFAAMPTYDGDSVYVATNNFDTGVGSVLAFDAETGAQRWEAEGHGDGAGNAPIVFGDLVIAGSSLNNWVAAYDRATGERRWVHSVGAAVSNSQLAADGVIVGGSQQDHRVWALDAYTGDLLWEDRLSDNVLSAPAMADGRLVVADRSGVVRAYEAPGTVTGTVAATDGAPLDAAVRVPATGEAVRTDPATGRFELKHRPGSYEVEAVSYGHRSTTAQLRIRSGQTTVHAFRLDSAGTGALRGVARDERGDPLAGVQVTLEGTPAAPVTTGADGAFAFDPVAEGRYSLTAARDGYAPAAQTVEVAVGEQTTAELTLRRYEIAVTGDHGGALTRLLESKGRLVDSTTIAEIADRPGDYRLIVANGANDDPGKATLERLLANADAAEVSVVFLDTWGISYGSLYHLWRHVGDPAAQGSGSSDGEVSLVARSEHPLTAGLAPGQRVEALAPNTEYAWFDDYSGRTVADVYIGRLGRTAGGGIGYKPRSLGSAHVLLSLHGASPWSGPTTGWTPAAHRVFDNAIAYGLDASFGAVEGTITDGGGQPLDATVTVGEESVTAGADGRYRLLLSPGSYTLRVHKVGYAPQELPVTVDARGTATVDARLQASGAGGVSGRITNAADGSPVAGASVLVQESGVPAATTGADGRYTIDGVPAGTYDVRVTAPRFRARVQQGVVVATGGATALDLGLRLMPRVAVVGDYQDRITELLDANEVDATATGWEALENLDAYDLVVLNDPTDPGEDAFLRHLAALDAAGKSAIFLDGPFSSDGTVRLLQRYLGEPTGRGQTSTGLVQLEARGEHPLFEGLPARVQVLAEGERGGWFSGYSGVPLADFGTSTQGTLGLGAAYEPRTPSSVRLLLGALSATVFAHPAAGWTDDGKRLFLNAIDWAAAPGMGAVAGRVLGPDGEPLDFARLRIAETGKTVAAGEGGNYVLPHAPGELTLEASAFGYTPRSLPVEVEAGRTAQLEIELAHAPAGSIRGVVTSSGVLTAGEPVEGAEIELVGHPRRATTAEDGSYALDRIEPGTYDVQVRAEGHVRRIVDGITVAAGAPTARDIELRPSPLVGLMDDYQGRAKAYLEHWGYRVQEVAWDDLGELASVDLVLANLASFPNLDPGDAGFRAFEDALNRAHVPVVWLDQFGRGSIRWLSKYRGDPVVRGEDRTDGSVSVRVDREHPLVAGLPVGGSVPLTGDNREYSWFSGFSGQTVASVVTGALGERGGVVGYRGRTAASVDVLLGTLSISTYGYPSVGEEPALNWSPHAERLLRNGLEYALDAPALAGEARGTVRSSAGGPLATSVRVVETGQVVEGRAGDGSFLVPLQPGDWTLELSAFGHETRQVPVSVAAGTVRTLDLTLQRDPVGAIAGTVRDEAGGAIAGASLRLEDTPLGGESDSAGGYRIDGVPAGEYTLTVARSGFRNQRLPVTVGAGETAAVDVRLEGSRAVAVAGDYQGRIGALLEGEGYTVVPWSWADVHQHVGDLDDVELVVLNGAGSAPTTAEFSTFMDAATAAGRSVILAGQFANGSIRVARTAFGDPATVTQGFTQGAIHYRPTEAHPIFAGFATGEPIELMRNPAGGTANQQYEWFDDYSGKEIARLGNSSGDLGGGVGVKFTSPTSVNVLLDSLGAAIYGAPGERWSADAERIYLNAVAWALDAAQAEIHGVVRGGGGEPVAGALVEAVEAGFSARTAADGTYRLGLPGGAHTIRVTAVGYEPSEQRIELAEEERRQVDVTLTAIPRGAIRGTAVDSGGAPLEGVDVGLEGPSGGSARTGADGAFAFDELLPGDYTVTLGGPGYLPRTVSAVVERGETTTLRVELRRNDVAVLGDAGGALVEFLRGRDVAAEERSWEDVEPGRYEVIVVNGGRPGGVRFEAVVDAADAAGTSVVFTGTWGVLNGGIRVLASHRPDEVAPGAHGYRDGAVSLTGIASAHPLFTGLADGLRPVADDGYWSVLDSYVGPYLARLSVGSGGTRGVAAAYDFRSAQSLHLLLSAGAASDLIGPGYGWTADGERLFLNAVQWARDARQAVPDAPSLATSSAPLVTAPSAALSGTGEFRSAVTVLRGGGAAVGAASPARDGAFALDAPLVEGPNTFTATARNYAGESAASEAVTVTRDTTAPALTWSPADHSGFFGPEAVVSGTVGDQYAGVEHVRVNGAPATLTGDRFTADVGLAEGENVLTVVARDRLGNERTETRRIRSFRYTTEWDLHGEGGNGELQADLLVRLANRRLTEVDSAVIELLDADGDVVASEPGRYIAGRYRAKLGRPAPGRYSLRARVVEEGWDVAVSGPPFQRGS